MKIKIRDRYVGDNCKPYIIAEIGANHNGDMNLCKKLIYEAKKAGADAVKFQLFSVDTVFSNKVTRIIILLLMITGKEKIIH